MEEARCVEDGKKVRRSTTASSWHYRAKSRARDAARPMREDERRGH